MAVSNYTLTTQTTIDMCVTGNSVVAFSLRGHSGPTNMSGLPVPLKPNGDFSGSVLSYVLGECCSATTVSVDATYQGNNMYSVNLTGTASNCCGLQGDFDLDTTIMVTLDNGGCAA